MAKLPYHGPRLQQLLGGQESGHRSAAPQTRADVAQLVRQGIALQAQGSYAKAAQYYRLAIAEEPGNADALHMLGTVALAALELESATDLIGRAAKAKPNDPAIRCNLANALMQKDQFPRAEMHLQKALKLDPGLAAARCFLADCKAAAGDVQKAKEIYETLLAQRPGEPQALIGYAHLCVTLGDFTKASALYRRAMEHRPIRARALAGLGACETFPADAPEMAEIASYLHQPGLAASDYVGLHYAAGRSDEEHRRYDKAFAHFTSAKQLSGATFDIAAHKEVVERLEALFTRDFFAARRDFGDASQRPVFIVGMPRSGTTLTEQIISGHPRAAAAGERSDIGDLAASLGLRRDDASEFVRRASALTSAEIRGFARKYLAVLARISPDAARITDKMPHNFLHLGLIALLFPNAKIVHCRRNPLDTCVSCFTTHLSLRSHGYMRSLSTLGEYYREYIRLMAHWREVVPVPVLDLDYQSLIEAPEPESRRLIAFLGLDWNPACLLTHESARPVNTASRLQVRQPIYRTSVERWQRYENHLAPLREALGDLAAASNSESTST